MDSRKPKRAVLVYFADGKDGSELRLDDVVLQPGQTDIWRKDVLFTSKPMSREELEKLEFSEKELANFGFNVFARLRAFLKGGEL
ncbi:MAG TPA: hypothetical protein VFV77_03725 [Gammaproteobacteria bacterium]|nr:hypothetical protein [Gammaproteobacteria bacterium]